MPGRSDKLLEMAESADQYELPYVSKSRVMEWTKNPNHFRLKYLEGIREPETDAMVRGTRIHETIEHYYLARQEVPGVTIFDKAALPDDRQMWADFVDPYLTNFAVWEQQRWDAADHNPTDFLPFGIEEEVWADDIIDEGPEWMGIADVILPAASIDDVDENNGVVIVDFKTGKVPQEKYRNEGIYRELAYYELLFENEYDVVAGAAFYPKAGELLVRPDGDYKQEIILSAREMVASCDGYCGESQFEAKEGPLCKWGFEDDEESGLYGVCSQCSWGAPAKNKETFSQMLDEGYADGEIAEVLGCTTNAVNYWKWKVNNGTT